VLSVREKIKPLESDSLLMDNDEILSANIGQQAVRLQRGGWIF